MKTLTELKKASDKLRAEICAREKLITRARNQKLVGKCFRYRNSYSSEESWWLFIRITDAGDNWPKTFQFQRTTRSFEVEPDGRFMGGERYEEITRAAFDAEWQAFLRQLAEAAQ